MRNSFAKYESSFLPSLKVYFYQFFFLRLQENQNNNLQSFIPKLQQEQEKILFSWGAVKISVICRNSYRFKIWINRYLMPAKHLSTYLSTYLSIYLCIYLFSYVSKYLSSNISIYLPTSLPIFLSIFLFIYLSFFLSIYLCIYHSLCLSISISMYLPLSLSFCLSISIYLST